MLETACEIWTSFSTWQETEETEAGKYQVTGLGPQLLGG